jgi:hypothetical protein
MTANAISPQSSQHPRTPVHRNVLSSAHRGAASSGPGPYSGHKPSSTPTRLGKPPRPKKKPGARSGQCQQGDIPERFMLSFGLNASSCNAANKKAPAQAGASERVRVPATRCMHSRRQSKWTDFLKGSLMLLGRSCERKNPGVRAGASSNRDNQQDS